MADPRLATQGLDATQRLISSAAIALFALGGMVAGWRLAYRRVKSSVTIAICFIAVTLLLNVAALAADPAAGGGFAPSIFLSVVWISYLLFSKRVKAVYSPDTYEDAEVFE